MVKKDVAVEKVDSALMRSDGLTITEIVKKVNLSRSAVRTALAKLDGAERVVIRQIGMAKVYALRRRRNGSK
jgi:DNA-binding transcriptional regulator GbsR (MarR family)